MIPVKTFIISFAAALVGFLGWSVCSILGVAGAVISPSVTWGLFLFMFLSLVTVIVELLINMWHTFK